MKRANKIKRPRAINIKRVEISLLKPHPDNPRRHPKRDTAAYERVTASLRHDYFDPLIFNQRNGMLVSGHLRLKIMQDLGFTHADVVVVDLSEAEHKARMIAANDLAGKNDKSALKVLLGGLPEKIQELTGLTGTELQKILGPPPGLEASADLAPDWEYRVAVLCRDEADQLSFADRMDKAGHDYELVIS